MYANIFVVMGVSMEKISYEKFVKLVNSFDEFNEKLLFIILTLYMNNISSGFVKSISKFCKLSNLTYLQF